MLLSVHFDWFICMLVHACGVEWSNTHTLSHIDRAYSLVQLIICVRLDKQINSGWLSLQMKLEKKSNTHIQAFLYVPQWHSPYPIWNRKWENKIWRLSLSPALVLFIRFDKLLCWWAFLWFRLCDKSLKLHAYHES